MSTVQFLARILATAMAALMIGALATPSARAATYTFTDLQVPGASLTTPIGLNDKGEVVGSYQDAAGGLHGFLLSHGSYTTLDYPGATSTTASGINDAGNIVGYYVAGSTTAGFYYSQGKFTSFQYRSYNTLATGISRYNLIAGYYTGPQGFSHGFVLSNGQLTELDYPGALTTTPYGVNAEGDVSGTYYDNVANAHGFLYLHGAGTYEAIDIKNTFSLTNAGKVNDKGLVAGYYEDPNTSTYQGFIRSSTQVVTFSVPGAISTTLSGINNVRAVVGTYFNAGFQTIGFVAVPQ